MNSGGISEGGIGVTLNNNFIRNNIATGNEYNGVYPTGASNNAISANNNGKLGNYYSSIICADADKDCICDSVYKIAAKMLTDIL